MGTKTTAPPPLPKKIAFDSDWQYRPECSAHDLWIKRFDRTERYFELLPRKPIFAIIAVSFILTTILLAIISTKPGPVNSSDGGFLLVTSITLVLGSIVFFLNERTGREINAIKRGEITDELIKKTNGEALVQQTLLLTHAFNDLVDQLEQRRRAAQLGLCETTRPEDEERTLERLNTMRAEIVRMHNVISLWRDTTDTSGEREQRLQILHTVHLEDVAESTRVRVDTADLQSPNAHIVSDLAEFEARLRASTRRA